MPWQDMAEKLRRSRMPLWTLESRAPVRDFDVLGFSLQSEALLHDLPRRCSTSRSVPLFASERTERDPLVLAGGPCTYNGGAGGAVLRRVGPRRRRGGRPTRSRDVVTDWKQAGGSRRELLWRLSELVGVYVPVVLRRPLQRRPHHRRHRAAQARATSASSAASSPISTGAAARPADRAVHADRARSAAAGDPARLHARLPLLPGGHAHAGPRASAHPRPGPARSPRRGCATPATRRSASSRCARATTAPQPAARGLLRPLRAGANRHLAALLRTETMNDRLAAADQPR